MLHFESCSKPTLSSDIAQICQMKQNLYIQYLLTHKGKGHDAYFGLVPVGIMAMASTTN